ncbi:hypothetical protein THAOC_34550 [Thalassiosira oceanica]|uniref:Uncharacterized protein n=1 Tax=Thalassiosira oceanica TaxID=159749 RepID=K0R2B8_THAOC|nr:hypothetical protein THAOC_34550 [Thalassiosira oceanica]|eukprot:EJK46768.1 hypothetical protein THAOC_34550 [Thalassiosira oceanica]
MALAQQPPRSLTDHAPAEAQVVESQIQELYTNHHIYAKLQNASNLSIEFYPTQVRLICGHMANCTPHKYRNETHTLPFHFFIIKSCHWQDHDWVCECRRKSKQCLAAACPEGLPASSVVKKMNHCHCSPQGMGLEDHD